jgi:V8-like Glu-specific endopeptidase
MYEITDRTAFPNSAIAYITVQFPDGFQARASGVIVGPNDVLTAMHVVFWDQHGGWASKISVLPGADTYPLPIQAPYGSFTDWGRVDSRTANWDTNGDHLLSAAESQWDLALIGMDSRIGDTTGWLGLSAISSDFNGTMVGYPKVGTGMMAQSVVADASSSYGVFDIAADLGPGASGGPLLYDSGGSTYVAGVLSSGAGDYSESTYAGLFGNGTWDWLTGAITANDDLIAGANPNLTGTSAIDALTGTSSADMISGLAGNDRITGGGGNDTIDGGAGIDAALFTGARFAYGISVSGSSATVADSVGGRDGTDSLANVERLWFSDQRVALDLGANAGVAAKTLGAVFGPSSVANKAWVGIALALVDNGMAYADLMQLALGAKLGPDFGNHALVDLLLTNLTGAAPSASSLALYEELLDSGAVSQVALGMAAANTAQNATNIDLVGLTSGGIEYMS